MSKMIRSADLDFKYSIASSPLETDVTKETSKGGRS
jgi:hypothetical protein